MLQSKDTIQKFIFDNTDIRGEIVTLEQSYQTVVGHKPVPPAVHRLLGEFLAAVSLLSSTLKFDGIITLQARGEGPLPLIMAECDHHQGLRGIANPDPDADFSKLEHASLRELLGKGVLAITIDPEKGQRYQGIVPLDADDLASCLEHYFTQSEQLDTRFWIAVDDHRAGALMVQALPRQESAQADHEETWQTVTALADTVKADELLSLDQETVLFRLFHEQQVRLLTTAPVTFRCSCSRPRSAKTLASLGREDIEALVAEQGKVSVDCQFCGQHYTFKQQDLNEIFEGNSPLLH